MNSEYINKQLNELKKNANETAELKLEYNERYEGGQIPRKSN
jgi:hypothetical protein